MSFRKVFGFFVVAALGVAASAEAQVLSYINFYADGLGGVTGIVGPRYVVVSPDGKHVYATGETSNSLAVFSRDALTGELTEIQTLFDGVGGIDALMGAQNIEISEDGKFLYVGATFENAISVFRRDRSTGFLTQVQVLRDGVDAPDGLSSTIWIKLSNDGKNVYSAGVGDSAVVVWTRSSSTGRLTFRQLIKDGVGGVDALGGAFGIAVAKNGKQVYVTGLADNSVTVFSRDKRNGDLTQVQVVTDGVDGVDGLAAARNVILGKNGKQAYVTGIADNAVSVFQVDRRTGALTQNQVLKDGVGGVDGLLQASGVIETRDGRYVFTAAFGEFRIGVFSRDPHDGSLTFVRALINGTDATGLRGVIGFALSGGEDDDEDEHESEGCGHLYSAGFRSNALTAFAITDCGDDEEDDD